MEQNIKTTHILLPSYLSFKLSRSKQKNNIVIDSIENPLSCGFGLSKYYPRKIRLYSTKLCVVICKILAH